ncbi:MAG TPA: ATP-binding protein [Solirubrobacteraceae bacterium]|nr:ATP-binding protein [Solirubrobacteraceae bacterium]
MSYEPSVVGDPAGLLEREREIERVHDALRAAGRRSGEALVIEGAAGMGKSRQLRGRTPSRTQGA